MQKNLCIAQFFNKDGKYDLIAVHSRDITKDDGDEAYRLIGQANGCLAPIPVVFLDRSLESPALCSFLEATARTLAALPPLSDRPSRS